MHRDSITSKRKKFVPRKCRGGHGTMNPLLLGEKVSKPSRTPDRGNTRRTDRMARNKPPAQPSHRIARYPSLVYATQFTAVSFVSGSLTLWLWRLETKKKQLQRYLIGSEVRVSSLVDGLNDCLWCSAVRRGAKIEWLERAGKWRTHQFSWRFEFDGETWPTDAGEGWESLKETWFDYKLTTTRKCVHWMRFL